MLSTLDLLTKYDVPGPRYTSYPTAPIWKESVGITDFLENLKKIKAHEPLSLYFHLPFCEKLCHFCGCMQHITKDHSISRPYVNRLLSEIKMVRDQIGIDAPVSQIHFGGGTPNFLQPNEMREIMYALRNDFKILSDAEIAIEMHPRTSTKEFCEMLAEENFNRISLGVQDFDENVQKLINRFQTYEMTYNMVNLLRSLGLKNFNFDLIYGLPGQNLATFQKTLDLTSKLNPDRLAVYSYAHVPWIRPVQRSFKDEDLPTPDTKIKIFEQALKHFTNSGYMYIGMDHFAKNSDELAQAVRERTIHRNFMGYSTRADAHQIGFGVSSISYVAGHYFQNKKKLEDYNAAIDNNTLATFRGFILNENDQIRRALITELMCHFYIDKKKFSEKFGIHFENYFEKELLLLNSFEDDGLLRSDKNKIEIVGKGNLVIRNIAMCFDEYLDEIRKKAVNPVFSRTV